MVVYACEPRGPSSKYTPFSRGFRVWLYRDFVKTKVAGWPWAFAVARAVFPEEPEPDENTIRDWYQNEPDYPEKLELLTYPSPAEYFKQWSDSNPGKAAELKKLMTFGAIEPGRRRFGIEAQEYVAGRHRVTAPVHFVQPQSYAPGGNLVGQFCGTACQILVVGFAAWCTGLCLEAATPPPKRGHA